VEAPLPDQPLPPPISQEQEFYLVAVTHLLTCRGIGMTSGPVPVTAIMQYCDVVGYENWERMVFVVTAATTELDALWERDKGDKA